MATGSDAVPELSTVRVQMGIVGHRTGMDRLVERMPASAFRLCYEKATKGVWRTRIDCASIS